MRVEQLAAHRGGFLLALMLLEVQNDQPSSLKVEFFGVLKIKKECEGPEMSPSTNPWRARTAEGAGDIFLWMP